LLLVELEIDGLGVLLTELRPQRLFLRLAPLQLRTLLVPHQHVDAADGEQQKSEAHRTDAHRQRPASRITRVECPQFLENVHCRSSVPPALALRIFTLAALAAASSAPAAVTWSAVSTKAEPGPAPLVVCTTSSSGLRSHCEPSMLRMKEETRVEDCATPSNFSRMPFCFTAVR